MTDNPYTARVTVTRLTMLDDARTHAFAAVAIGSALVLHGVRIVRRGDGLHVIMPVRETDGFKYGAEIVDARLREAIEAAVLEAWGEAQDE